MTTQRTLLRGLFALCIVAQASCDTRITTPTSTTATPNGPHGAPPGPTAPAALSNDLQGMIDRTNGEREKYGVAKLSSSATLNHAAELTATQLMTSGVFAHDIPGAAYPFPTDRLKAAGYNVYSAWGENIGKGAAGTTVTAMVAAWIASPEHHENLVRASFSQIGVAIVVAPNGTVYMVQEFAHP